MACGIQVEFGRQRGLADGQQAEARERANQTEHGEYLNENYSQL